MPKPNQKRSNEEIEKEKEEQRKKLRGLDEHDFLSIKEPMSERKYAKEMKKILSLRKSLLLVEKKRKLKIYDNEMAVLQALELINTILEEVDCTEPEHDTEDEE